MPGSELVNSVSRALNILELVGSSPSGTTLRALASLLHLKKPTVHNLLRTLTDRQYLIKSRRPIRYFLGPALQSVRRMESDRKLLAAARPLLVSLCRQYQADVCLLEYVGSEVIAITGARRADDGVLEFYDNWRAKPYGTALVFQAYWPERIRKAYRERHPLTPESSSLWKSIEQVDLALAQVRERGYLVLGSPARSPGQATVRIAAPIFHRREIAAALALMKPAEEVTPDFRERCARKMLSMAEQLTEALTSADDKNGSNGRVPAKAAARETRRDF